MSDETKRAAVRTIAKSFNKAASKSALTAARFARKKGNPVVGRSLNRAASAKSGIASRYAQRNAAYSTGTGQRNRGQKAAKRTNRRTRRGR